MGPKVVEFPSEGAKDRQSLEDMLKDLADFHAAGQIENLMVVRFGKDGAVYTRASRALTLSQMAYGIAAMHKDLMELMQ
jgi:hypothetical protein